jgi:hypothetical protein
MFKSGNIYMYIYFSDFSGIFQTIIVCFICVACAYFCVNVEWLFTI